MLGKMNVIFLLPLLGTESVYEKNNLTRLSYKNFKSCHNLLVLYFNILFLRPRFSVGHFGPIFYKHNIKKEPEILC